MPLAMNYMKLIVAYEKAAGEMKNHVRRSAESIATGDQAAWQISHDLALGAERQCEALLEAINAYRREIGGLNAESIAPEINVPLLSRETSSGGERN
jgi:hypothetical protein